MLVTSGGDYGDLVLPGTTGSDVVGSGGDSNSVEETSTGTGSISTGTGPTSTGTRPTSTGTGPTSTGTEPTSTGSSPGSGSNTESSGYEDYDFEHGLGDYTTSGSGIATGDYMGPGGGPNSEDYFYDGGDDDESKDESNINLNGTTFVIIINDNDNINSVSLTRPNQFLSFIRPNISVSPQNDASLGDFGDQWSETSGTNKLCISATSAQV